MKIEFAELLDFEDVDIKEVIEYCGEIYLKVSPMRNAIGKAINAICLQGTEDLNLYSSDKVKLVNCKLVREG